MKGIDIFCASQSATAICLGMEEGSTSSPLSITLLASAGDISSGRAIDRHNPIIRDSRRLTKTLPPCTITSQPPISSKHQKVQHYKKKKKQTEKIPFKENKEQFKKSSPTNLDDGDIKNSNGNIAGDGNGGGGGVGRWSCTRPGDFISPPGSTRYLLREKVLLNSLSDFDTKLSLEETTKSNEDVKTEEVKSPSLSDSPDQVVELRVSLHCRGCERKLRKHLSRMEGVTSFNIEFAAKKVTVSGKVTPLGVLSSISKVKNAQLWSPSISSSSSSSTPHSLNLVNSESNNDYKGAGA